MSGTRPEVTRAITRMPPRITAATEIARKKPKVQPSPDAKLSWPPVAVTNWANAWFAWNMPVPIAPKTRQTP